ncbi:hypothetical protein KP509_14G005000 [Ceratopteris richardii]|uniref:Uncharacterized protein n=1 Tax=Ceratopteris richardii TaxID=49495 RepID=A0A8T2T6R2_CERRI|nr:hypothetical protein KP509_14G005000 [Ceratopteris richardii]
MKGHRPATPEDTVFFSLFTHSVGDASLDEKLQSLRTECLAAILPLTAGYIWQHETFDLSVQLNEASNASCSCAIPPDSESAEDDVESSASATRSTVLPPHLHGKLKYGDNIEDEWFVVFILFAISRQFPEVCIRVWDTDGEFLLIEAAYSIPRWLKPENSWNRILIKTGELHILPLPKSPAEIIQIPLRPSIEDALRILYNTNIKTKAEESVQASILHRMEEFRRNPYCNMHNVVCRVPLPVAQILKHEPQLIALAVEAFYDRDVESMKVVSRMRQFLPNNKDAQMVNVLVRMSRAMYAQLRQQVFQAPPSYPMPPVSDPHYAEAEIGMKITCGFEIMYWDRSNQGKLSATNSVGCKNLGWQSFLASLKKTGYFKDLLEGSKEYRERMDRAVSCYKETSLFVRMSAAMNAPIQRIAEILLIPSSVEDYSGSDIVSDDDSWMYNGESELQKAILERQQELEAYECGRELRKKRRGQKVANEEVSLNEFSGEEVVRSMHTFIDKMSSFEGAEIPIGEDDDRPVTVRMETFMKELKSILGYSEMEKSNSNGEDTSSDEMDDFMSDADSDSEAMEGGNLMKKDAKIASMKGKRFMEEYDEALTRELTSSSLAKSFVSDEGCSLDTNKMKGSDKEEMDGLPPVNIDVNLLQNILESYSSQHGLPGPASNLLGAMGIRLPEDKDQMS